MHRPVCSKDQTEFRPTSNEVNVLDTAGPDQLPYQLWAADEWTCPACGFQIVVGFGDYPLAAKHHEGFNQRLEDSQVHGELQMNHEYPIH